MHSQTSRRGGSKLSLKKKSKQECPSPAQENLSESPPTLVKSDFAVNLTPAREPLSVDFFFSTQKRLALEKEPSLNDAVILADDSDVESESNALNAVRTKLFAQDSDDSSAEVEVVCSQKPTTTRRVVRESTESTTSQLDNSVFGPSQKANVASWISKQPFQTKDEDASPPTLYSQKDDSVACLEDEEDFLSVSAHVYHEPNRETAKPVQNARSKSADALTHQLQQLSLRTETKCTKQSLNVTIELTSDDDDDKLGNFFQKIRLTSKKASNSKQDDSLQFIDDESLSSEESISMYLTPANQPRKIKSQPIISSTQEGRKGKTLRKPPSLPNNTAKNVVKADAKRKQLASIQVPESVINTKTCSFLGSLSSTVLANCHPEAVQYIKNFKKTKENLTQRLFQVFNKDVFDDKLPSDMEITWNARLLRTAGYCKNMTKKHSNGTTSRLSAIELSSKVLDDAGRLRDTLVHELCHAAVWIIDECRGGHGPLWKKWALRAMRKFPELPPIKVCHNFEITCRYEYRCTACPYSIGRHSKSVDVQRQVCPLCKSWLYMVDTKSKRQPEKENKPTSQATANAFALFVKQHYKVVKASQQGLSHKEVMQMLSTKFAAFKLEKEVQMLTLKD